MSWRQQLKEQREMKSQGVGMVYDRVVILMQVEKDEDFQKWCSDSERNLITELDQEVDDLCVKYRILKRLMNEYPAKSDWTKHGLKKLVAMMMSDREKGTTRETISWKDRCLAAEKECERLRGELKIKEAQVANLEKILMARTSLGAA
jgi:hypothetical protein